jgi:hypothetical protein
MSKLNIPVTETAEELKQTPIPADMFAYRVVLFGQARFTYGRTGGEAMLRAARAVGTVARIDKTASPDKILGELQALAPEQRAALLERLAATSVPAPAPMPEAEQTPAAVPEADQTPAPRRRRGQQQPAAEANAQS